MKLKVNGSERALPDGTTVAGLVSIEDLPGSGGGVAVAVDAEVIPRTAWEDTKLSEGQRVELLAAIQGG